jgi:hypothetical protein
MDSNHWVVFGFYKWSKAVVDLCLQYECKGDKTKLHSMLHSYYGAYRHHV